MANIKDFIKKIGNETVSLEEQQRALAAVEQTIVEAKAKREESIGKNVDLVISALKKIESDLEAKLIELNNTPAKQGVAGPKGEKGRDGRDGKDGYKGQDGKDGVDGKDGKDGEDGISVTDAKIDFDGSLVITLSDGREIDAGTVLSVDAAKHIHSVQTGGTGSTSQAVLDAIAAIQATLATYGTMATQNANAVAITGGSISGLSSPLPIDSGGTGATTSTGSGAVVLASSPTIAGLTTTGTLTSAVVSANGAITFSTTSSTINIGTSQVVPALTIGGVSQTGILTVGRSTATQTTNIQAGATASGSTKTINIGTAGLSGSTTAISIGSAVSGATSTTTVNGNLVVTGGTIDNTVIGGTTPAAGTFTTITGQTEVLKGTGENLVLRSSDLTVSPWAALNVTLTGSQSDPFGGTTASLFNDGTAASTQHYIAQNFSNLAANTYTYSVYAKAGTGNYVGIYSPNPSQGAFFNLTTGAFSANIVGAPNSYSITNAGSGWWRISIVVTTLANSSIWLMMSEDGTNYTFTGTSKTVYVAAPQIEIGATTNTYVSTAATAVYGTPTLSFSGVAGLGLQSDGSLYVSPAGTGALQAQATTSSTVGGNARGANAVDWQTSRGANYQVASGSYGVIAGGTSNQNNSFGGFLGSGNGNYVNGSYSAMGGGQYNQVTGALGFVGAGYTNYAQGYFNVVVGGANNTGTSASAVTTQSGTMNGTTAVTLSGSNANIKVGQLITGTSIASTPATYVAAISGTSLTLSQNASGSSTSTLSFYTPHGVVVGGGNNQATGSYSFIGGGGDAGTAANRNVASGAWSFVGGGNKNTASGDGAFVGGGGINNAAGSAGNTASGESAVVVGGILHTASGKGSFIGSGYSNNTNAQYSTIAGGVFGTARGISGNTVFPACVLPVAFAAGVSQAALLVIGKETTNATATALTCDGGAAGTTNQVILPNNSAYYFTGEVVSGVTGGGNTKGWEIAGVIKRGANAGATTLVGSTVSSLYGDAGAATWTIGLTADTSNGGLAVTFTGQASTTIRTVCRISTVEMTY